MLFSLRETRGARFSVVRRYKPARVGNERVLQKRGSAHSGPESCAVRAKRKAEREALTGVRVGWVLSREMELSSGSRRGHATRKATVLLSILRDSTTLRGRRPQACSETLVREPGDPGSAHGLRNGGPEGETR